MLSYLSIWMVCKQAVVGIAAVGNNIGRMGCGVDDLSWLGKIETRLGGLHLHMPAFTIPHFVLPTSFSVGPSPFHPTDIRHATKGWEREERRRSCEESGERGLSSS